MEFCYQDKLNSVLKRLIDICTMGLLNKKQQ